ncbi:hypothetical protein [Fusibacter ferrireducens]|uniref:NfeD-like C-terminal domain-containing protein n=1 Tax=Fusibacter ferrireducens TaxID=2785058 RepID=A0ABR9ZU23_9FIRM|nr:hypothetical protein [Fusibacter ferrireducens]MBF4693986.1 hypothetical protein [Fusibacter ferrireducens]
MQFTLENVYLYVAIPASLILVIQTLMTIFGLSGEVDADFDADGDVDITGASHITIFSVRNIVAFFTFFGWSGLWLLSKNMSIILTLLFSIVIGLIFVMISMGMFLLISKMQRNGTLNFDNALGQVGEVYIPIPPNRQGVGKVMIAVQGSLKELEAITDESSVIKTGIKIKVVAIFGTNQLLVETYSPTIKNKGEKNVH